jgi:hypothetical protein
MFLLKWLLSDSSTKVQDDSSCLYLKMGKGIFHLIQRMVLITNLLFFNQFFERISRCSNNQDIKIHPSTDPTIFTMGCSGFPELK